MDNMGNRRDSFRNSLRVTPEDRARRREEENLKTIRELEHFAEYRYTNKLPVRRTRMIKGAKTWVGEHKKAVAISLAALIAAAGIGGAIHTHNQRIDDSQSLSYSILMHDNGDIDNALKTSTLDENGNYTLAQCSRPHLFALLQSTDIDELIDEYKGNPTRENLKKLENRVTEIARLPHEMYNASMEDFKPEGGKVKLTYESEIRNNIEGYSVKFSNSKGTIADAFKAKSDVNEQNAVIDYDDFSAISKEAYNKLKIVIINADNAKKLEAGEELGFDMKSLTKKYIERYMEAKRELMSNELVLENGVLCLKGIDDGKYYKFDNSNKEIKELNERFDEERE